MAYMVPDALPSRATAGERRLYETLRMHLPEDYIVYYEPEIDGRRSGVVAIGPDLGLVALQVKDYTSRSIQAVDGDSDEWRIWSGTGEAILEPNPVRGAKEEARRIAAALKRDRTLTEGNGAGLKVAVGYGVVFPRMSLAELRRAGLDECVDPAFVFCRDEIDAEADDFAPEALFDKLQGMVPARRPRRRTLSREELRAVRTHLFAEPRVGAALLARNGPPDQLLLSAHAIDAPDQTQEQLARTLGDRHRLIRGATGSGKTLVLAHRARVLAKMNPEWRILVLCNGMALSGSLRRTIDRMLEEPEDLFDFPSDPNDRRSYGIEVYNFREWLRGELRMKEEDVPALLRALDRGEAILPSYDAILIDEGQDFEPGWLRLVSSCLNPRTKSLLLVEDRASSMFRRKSSLARDTGLDFRGRSKVLSLSYRNTAQIVRFAWEFFQAFSLTGDAVRLGSVAGTELIPPQAAKRRGPEP
ncbi:MAG TPA: NERD domain-containing protein, partial [Paenibacillus sp.]|nr:NERD domain-containing protein [Paenibacillus sp.]